MKNLKALFLLLIGAIAMSLTSCNTDDGYSAYTPEQQKQIQSQMYGTYTGKLKIQKPSADGRKWESMYNNITSWDCKAGDPYRGEDSLIVVRNFPINMLDSAIYISSKDESDQAKTLRALRTAISKLPAEDIKCKYFVPSTDPQFTLTNGYKFILNPYIISKKLEYNGESHTVYFVFQMNYYVGIFTQSSSRNMKLNMLFASISIDKEPVDYYPSFPINYFRPLIVTCGYE